MQTNYQERYRKLQAQLERDRSKLVKLPFSVPVDGEPGHRLTLSPEGDAVVLKPDGYEAYHEGVGRASGWRRLLFLKEQTL